MSDQRRAEINDQWIVSNRGPRNHVDASTPYAWLVEQERTASGNIEDTAIIFLTNRECPFHCLMCDLWKNTVEETVAPGVIPAQIKWALDRMPPVRHLKLYNSGSFFDPRAIPETDYENIAGLVSHFETVIVECHPKLVNERCLRFAGMLSTKLQVAMGLETVHPEVLQKLNKKMTSVDFARAADFLKRHQILSRAFVLLKPPYLSEDEGVFWAERSIEFAFGSGVECCTIIPVRPGNGAMDLLKQQGDFIPPDIQSLEKVLEYGIGLHKGRVFADTWDLKLFSSCDHCLDTRIKRLEYMNLHQELFDQVTCKCSHNAA
jgi:radical SAM enzyme (TIGR01210 family)